MRYVENLAEEIVLLKEEIVLLKGAAVRDNVAQGRGALGDATSSGPAPDLDVAQLSSVITLLEADVSALKVNRAPSTATTDPDVRCPPVAVTKEIPVVVETQHCDRTARKSKVKLETYAGQGASLEAFLQKYEVHSRYLKWDEDDRIFHLKNSLTGPAATVLWAGGSHATAAELITLLKNRHGTQNQLERFWLELYARKRKPTESLQDLYQDIRRLISLACPNDASDTAERLAINQFTSAFDNDDLRFEVLNQNSTTLERALHFAMRVEALKPAHSASQGMPTPVIPSRTVGMSASVHGVPPPLSYDSLRVHRICITAHSVKEARHKSERARTEENIHTMVALQQKIDYFRSRYDQQVRAEKLSGARQNEGGYFRDAPHLLRMWRGRPQTISVPTSAIIPTPTILELGGLLLPSGSPRG